MTVRLNSLGFRLLLGYLIPLVLFLSAALVAYVTIQRLLAALDREGRAQQVFTKAYKLKEGIASMAANKATHHLLGDAAFEKLFEARHRDVVAELAALRELTADYPDRLAQIEALADLERRWHGLARADFELFREGPGGDRPRQIPKDRLEEDIALQLQMR